MASKIAKTATRRRFPGLPTLSSSLPKRITTVRPKVRHYVVESMLSSRAQRIMRTYGIWPVAEVPLPTTKTQKRAALQDLREASAEMSAALAHVDRITDPKLPRTQERARIAHYATNAFGPLVLRTMAIKEQLKRGGL